MKKIRAGDRFKIKKPIEIKKGSGRFENGGKTGICTITDIISKDLVEYKNEDGEVYFTSPFKLKSYTEKRLIKIIE